MIPSTLKTIFVDGDLDDSSILLDVQHPYRDKDLLLTNHFDDVDDDIRDQITRRTLKISIENIYFFYPMGKSNTIEGFI
ncbi:unnamed protein product [Rotaria socialis]